MASVGTAYVTIKVNTKGFTAQLDKMMAGLSKKMEKHGNDMGKAFTKGLNESGGADFFKRLADEAEKASRRASDSLDKIGGSLDRNRQKSNQFAEDLIDGMDAVGDTAKNTRKDIDDLGQGINDANRNARRLGGSLNGIGSGGGGLRTAANDAGFFSNAMRSLARDAEAGAATLHHLYNAEAFLGTAAAALVGGVSAAAQGIFALASEALAAAPALSVLSNAMIGFIQIGGTIKAATSGVSEAIKAGFAQSSAAVAASTSGISSSVNTALRSVRDAKQGLADAYRESAQAAADAARRVADAERGVAAAQNAVRAAQLALNAARKEGLEQLEDIAFAAEDADLAQQRAALNLEDAYNALQQVQNLPPDDRARREAELSYKEAELQYREAKDRKEDANKEQKHAQKTGVKGTEAMQTAYDNLRSAQDELAQSKQALSDARAQEAQVAVENARRIQDAQERLADAQSRLAEAQAESAAGTTAATTALDKYDAALKKLGPNQRAFVKNVIASKQAFSDARNTIAEPMFDNLNRALDKMVGGNAWDVVIKGMAGTSNQLGILAENSIDLANTPAFSDRLGKVMTTNNQALGIFGGTFQNLLQLLVNVATAARPLVITFANWTKKVTDGWLATRNTNEQIEAMRKRFVQAGAHAARLKDFVVALWKVIATMGRAAAIATRRYQGLDDKLKNPPKGTHGFFVRMTTALDKFNKKISKPGNFKRMVKGFDQSLQNMEALAKAAKNAIADPLIKMGQDPQIEAAFDKFSKTKVFDRLAKAANDAAPELAELAVSVAEILADMAESGSIKHFLDWLGKAAKVVEKVVGAMADSGVLRFLGYITAGAALFRILYKVMTIALGPLVLFGKKLGTVGKAFSNFVNKDADPNKKFSARWSRAWESFKRTGSNSITTVKNGFAKLQNTFGKVANFLTRSTRFKTDRTPTTKLPAPDVTPPTADAADKARAQAAGLSMTEAFALGIREGLPAKDAAMNALRQNVLTMLNTMNPVLEAKANMVGVNIIVGLVSGIEEFTAEVIAAARAAGKAAADAVGDGAQVKSPSRITMIDGEQIMAGLTVGIKEGQAGAMLAAEAAGAQVAGAVGTGAAGATGAVSAVGATVGAGPSAALGAGPAPAAVGKFGRFGKMLGPITKLAKPLAGAMKLVGGAFSLMLGPVGMIVLTLFPILWPLLKKLEEKTHIFSKAMDGLAWVFDKVVKAAKWFGEKVMNFISPVIDFIKDHWKPILAILTGPFGLAIAFVIKFKGKIGAAISSVVDWVKDHWKLLLAILLAPFGGIVVYLVAKFWPQITGFFDDLVGWLGSVPGKIKDALSDMWDAITDKLGDARDKVTSIWGKFVSWVKGRPAQFKANLKLLWAVVTDKFTQAKAKVLSLWGKFTTWIKGRPAQFKANLKLLWSVITDKFTEAKNKLLSLWGTFTTWVKGRPAQFVANLKLLWAVIVDKFNEAKTKVQDIWSRFSDWVRGLPDKIHNSLSHLWDGLKDGFATACAWVIDHVQSWLLDPLNSILHKFGADGITITLPSIPGHAEGGWVRGPGGPKDDRVLRRLSNGEYVLPARSARNLGPDALEYMRKYGKLPDTGGLWGAIKAGGNWVKGGITEIGDAIAHGAKYAIEWAVSNFATKLPSNFVSDSFVGGLKWAAGKFVAFGDKLDESANKWVYPVDHIVPISQHPNSGHKPPNAVDFDGDYGDRVRAAAAGTVAAALQWSTSYGNHIIIRHLNGLSTLYAHLQSMYVKSGQQVQAGQTIGLMGSTGNSTGAHLHFEINPSTDSEALLRKLGVKFAKGGIARATDGGILSVIAEAGKNERVEPLDSQGMSKRDHVLLEMIRSLIQNAQSGDTWNIHPAPGMNELEFSKQVRREVVFHRRRGA